MADGTNIGKAYVQIVPSMDGISSKISEELNQEIKGSGQSKISKIGEGIGTVIGTGLGLGLKGVGALAKVSVKAIGAGLAGATAGITAISKEAMSAYADTEQLVGGLETIYEDLSTDVAENASRAYKTAGLSANEYMETAMGFSASLTQSLLKSDGDIARSADLTDQIIVDMADNANKMGTSMESIQTAYAGFSKQNYTMLDNLKLGYGGTKTEMERLLKDAEKISGIKYNIDSFADVTEAIHVMQVEMGIAGTTAKEGSATISGSIATMQGAWTNLVSSLANPDADLGQLTTDLVDSIKSVIDNVVPVITQTLPSITGAITQLVNQVAPMLPALINDVLPSLLTAINALLQGLIQALPSILQALDTIIPMIVDVIVENLPAIMTAGLQIIVTLATAIIDAIPKLLKAIPEIFKAMKQAFASVDWKTIGTNIIEGIKNGLSMAWGKIIEWLKSKCGEMISTVKSFFGIHSPSTVFRDQIGVNLALGIGQGFVDEMDSVNKEMEKSVQTEFDIDSNARLNSQMNSNVATSGTIGEVGLLSNLVDRLNSKLDELQNMQIVLDSGVLVGATAPAMNTALGRISAREVYR